MQVVLEQSPPTEQVSPSVQSGQIPPPQSTSVSLPFWTLSVQRQAPAPLQTSAPHSGSGSVPAAYGVQVPSLPETLQASQVPPQAVSQQ